VVSQSHATRARAEPGSDIHDAGCGTRERSCWAVALWIDGVTPGTVLLHKGLPLADKVFGFGRSVLRPHLSALGHPWHRQARDQAAKIVNGLLFLALSLIDIAAVVVGKRADGIEPNRRRIILNGRVEFAFCRYARPRLLRATTLPGLSRRASPKSAIARL
jgi:hypothetical protein